MYGAGRYDILVAYLAPLSATQPVHFIKLSGAIRKLHMPFKLNQIIYILITNLMH